ncbi:uncharacterized protein [Physcomitrium patens]|uniref:J domain-containing protein n=1 Tax=Physcomitrium patens TaxID=3218 RepID=A9T6M3_PHYPA|nr:uncharacterized protein LOC112295888 [Physcomitrium patens]PNR34156.1 hypothetical protein PHYPA_023973 [Physcomitrium patens]|eukprot:XP_024403680.1 uncharacterized protein LOC112295888 [Physcomitrella patens]
MELCSGFTPRHSSSPVQTMQLSRRPCDSFVARASSVNFHVDAPTAVNFGKILGVNPSASKSELKAAYRKLALRFHPDVCKSGDKSEVDFMEVNRAYESLMAIASSGNQVQQGYVYSSYDGESSAYNGFEAAKSASAGQEDDPWASFLQSLVNGTHEELREDYSNYYSNLKQYSKASRNKRYQYYQGNW